MTSRTLGSLFLAFAGSPAPTPSTLRRSERPSLVQDRAADAGGRRFTRDDPACRRVLAKLLWRRRWMKRNALPLVLEGARVQSSANTDVRTTWKRHGWRPEHPEEPRRVPGKPARSPRARSGPARQRVC